MSGGRKGNVYVCLDQLDGTMVTFEMDGDSSLGHLHGKICAETFRNPEDWEIIVSGDLVDRESKSQTIKCCGVAWPKYLPVKMIKKISKRKDFGKECVHPDEQEKKKRKINL